MNQKSIYRNGDYQIEWNSMHRCALLKIYDMSIKVMKENTSFFITKNMDNLLVELV